MIIVSSTIEVKEVPGAGLVDADCDVIVDGTQDVIDHAKAAMEQCLRRLGFGADKVTVTIVEET